MSILLRAIDQINQSMLLLCMIRLAVERQVNDEMVVAAHKRLVECFSRDIITLRRKARELPVHLVKVCVFVCVWVCVCVWVFVLLLLIDSSVFVGFHMCMQTDFTTSKQRDANTSLMSLCVRVILRHLSTYPTRLACGKSLWNSFAAVTSWRSCWTTKAPSTRSASTGDCSRRISKSCHTKCSLLHSTRLVLVTFVLSVDHTTI